MPFKLGRPKTRPPTHRVSVEIDRKLYTAVENNAPLNTSLRQIVEDALRAWLDTRTTKS